MRFRSLGSMLLLFAATFGLVVTASADSIIFLGLRYTALGSAKLQLVNGALVVSNIGPSGSDGVLIALPSNTTLFDLEISPLGSASSMSLGSFLRQTSFEVGSSQPVWIVQSTDIGNAVATGFTVLPPWPSLTADYFLGGVLVGTKQIVNGALFYTQSQEAPINRTTRFARRCIPGGSTVVLPLPSIHRMGRRSLSMTWRCMAPPLPSVDFPVYL